MYKIRFIAYAWLCCSVLTLTGCMSAKHIQLSKSERSKIKSVYVDPKVELPKELYLYGEGRRAGAIFGPIGVIMGGSADIRTAQSLSKYAHAHHIDMDKIVNGQWNNQLKSKKLFKLADKPGAVQLKTRVNLYGLTLKHGFSKYYLPVVSLVSRLEKNNKIIWQNETFVSNFDSGLPEYKESEYMSDPKKLYVMWNKAAERAVTRLVNDIKSA